jgi:hypothetical protein
VLFLVHVPSTAVPAEVALVLTLLGPREAALTAAATLIVEPRASLDVGRSLNMANGIWATLVVRLLNMVIGPRASRNVDLVAAMEVVNQVTMATKVHDQSAISAARDPRLSGIGTNPPQRAARGQGGGGRLSTIPESRATTGRPHR